MAIQQLIEQTVANLLEKSPSTTRQRKRRALSPRVQMECLEQRTLMAAAGIEFNAAKGQVTIQGTDQSDVAEIRYEGTDTIHVTLQNEAGFSQEQSFPSASVKRILFEGDAGDDQLQNHTEIPVRADGGLGNDQLTGGAGNDILEGGDGDDILVGGSGNDTLDGNAGADQLFGDVGNDRLVFDHTDLAVDGGSGSDLADARKSTGGVDLDMAASGLEKVYGTNFDDVITAEGVSGRVTVYGYAGNDQLTGGAGNDILRGGDGDDVLIGGEGRDSLNGEAGADRLFGDAGNDSLAFDNTDVTVDGGSGNDLGDGRKSSEGIVLDLAATGLEKVYGTRFDDVITAEGVTEPVSIWGMAGNDRLTGGAGNDKLHGGTGNDALVGGGGNDYILGHDGDDLLVGGAGRDDLRGGRGDDLAISDEVAPNDTAAIGRVVSEWAVGRGFTVLPRQLVNDGTPDLINDRQGTNAALENFDPSDVRSLAFDGNGELHVLRNDGRLERQTDDGWEFIDGDVLKLVRRASGTFYYLTTRNTVHDTVRGPATPIWGGVQDFAVDQYDRVYLLGTTGGLERQTVTGVAGDTENGWAAIDTDVVKMLTRADGGIQYLTTRTTVHDTVRGPEVAIWGGVRDFAVDQYDRVYLLGTTEGLERQTVAGVGGDTRDGWQPIDTDVVKMLTRADGTIFYLTMRTTVHDTVRGPATPIWGGVRDFAVDQYDRVYLLGTTGGLERQTVTGVAGDTENGWAAIDTDVVKMLTRADGGIQYLTTRTTVHDTVRGPATPIWGGVRDFAVDQYGRVYLLGTTGGLERQTVTGVDGDTKDGWAPIDNEVIMFDLINGRDLFLLFTDGRITLNGDSLRPNTANVKDFFRDANGNIYVIHTDGMFERYVDHGWQLLDTDMAEYELGSDGEVYSLGRDGTLWRHDSSRVAAAPIYSNNVREFSIQNGELWVTNVAGDIEVTLLYGDAAGFMDRARQRDAGNSNVSTDTGRGVRGGVVTENYLISKYGDATAPRTILDSVVEVFIPGFIGTGTLLAYGGNRYVLTAAHVVENQTGVQHRPADVDVVINGVLHTVVNVFGRAVFAGRDLALLELSNPVAGVQGAAMSSVTPWNNIELLVVGFGQDDNGNSGTKLFGFANYDLTNHDPKDFIPTNGVHPAGIGEHIINHVEAGEAASAPGDSGGPDFLMRHRNIGGQWVWIPEIVGVHSTGNEDQTSSTQLTPEVVRIIENLIGDQRVVLDFYLFVKDDGDHTANGAGDWHMTLTVNNTPVLSNHYQEFHDNILRVTRGEHIATYSTTVNEAGNLAISFYGYEDDTFGEDEIPRLDAILALPNAMPISGLRSLLGVRDGEDTAYELYVEFRVV